MPAIIKPLDTVVKRLEQKTAPGPLIVRLWSGHTKPFPCQRLLRRAKRLCRTLYFARRSPSGLLNDAYAITQSHKETRLMRICCDRSHPAAGATGRWRYAGLMSGLKGNGAALAPQRRSLRSSLSAPTAGAEGSGLTAVAALTIPAHHTPTSMGGKGGRGGAAPVPPPRISPTPREQCGGQGGSISPCGGCGGQRPPQRKGQAQCLPLSPGAAPQRRLPPAHHPRPAQPRRLPPTPVDALNTPAPQRLHAYPHPPLSLSPSLSPRR